MTEEDTFQAAIDAAVFEPNGDLLDVDWTTHLVFADWLQEREDPRAHGYRALGELRLCARRFTGVWGYADGGTVVGNNYLNKSCRLPEKWFLLTKVPAVDAVDEKLHHRCWRDFTTRRAADDAAALAFSELSPADAAEILAGRIHA